MPFHLCHSRSIDLHSHRKQQAASAEGQDASRPAALLCIPDSVICRSICCPSAPCCADREAASAGQAKGQSDKPYGPLHCVIVSSIDGGTAQYQPDTLSKLLSLGKQTNPPQQCLTTALQL
eukprot:CAMPEP_0115292478 /NCGR_PEP_ID=MMETSP0270-20121206/65152_1 /TAXON_ID=71861 /ORGANISM="Scrippsiella trochoidea, Strain CCMP3099" /LENGTH=120 /DNA_ID=CAMNT_0002709903 /DNA_START=725 /DNA_END=1084 /DNA_ORIENTATION=-